MNKIKIKQGRSKSQMTGEWGEWGRELISVIGYYASSLAIACDPRQEKGELCGEGADHVVPGPHAAGPHNTMLCQQLSPCLPGSPAHFTSLTVDENFLTLFYSTGYR